MSDTQFIILAAGKGSRMGGKTPKPLRLLAGWPLIVHVIDIANNISTLPPIVVTAAESIAEYQKTLPQNTQYAIQKVVCGTGDAIKSALPYISEKAKKVIILYGDAPFFGMDNCKELLSSKADLHLSGFHCHAKNSYGQIITKHNKPVSIIEAKDRTADHNRDNAIYNAGPMAIKTSKLSHWLERIKPSASKEYYLTDICDIANEDNSDISLSIFPMEASIGINDPIELAEAEAIWQKNKRIEMINNNVYLQAPDTVFFSYDTKIEPNVTIEPYVVFGRNVDIKSETIIKSFSHLEGASIKEDVSVGPFARIRPNTELAKGSKIGNFVETKAAKIDKGSKVNHLSYIGDAHIGENTNIGAGTITCNYDGKNKHQTVIENDCFIGSNSALVAPIKIAKNSIVAAGSTITKDVNEPSTLAIARTKEIFKKRNK